MLLRRWGILAAGLSALLWCFAAPVAFAQQAKRPVGIVSIAPLDSFLKDISYLLRAANVPEIGGLVTIMANQYTQGLDRSRPVGVSIQLEGDVPAATIFLPMSNRGQFFAALAGMGIEPDDLGGGLFEIDASGQTIFAKDSGTWMFVAQSEDALANVPADPSTALGELPNRYDLAFMLNVQAMPPELKQWASEQMRTGFERSLAEQSDQSDAEREAARQLGVTQIEQIERLINETQQIIFGYNSDQDAQKIYIDVAAQFIEGTKLAQQAAAMQSLTTNYGDFAIPGAAVRLRFTSEIPEEDREMQIQALRNSMAQLQNQQEQSGLPPEAQTLIKQFVQGLSGILEQTIAEGTFDGAGSLSVADNSLSLLIGGRVADGKALENEVKKIAEGLSGKPNAPQFQFDYETYKDVTLHRATIAIDSGNPNINNVFGDSLNVIIGTGPKSFLIGLDPSGDAIVKSAIDRVDSAQSVAAKPLEAVFELSQLLRFAQSVSPNSMIDNAIQTLQQYADKDKVEITGSVIPRGGMYRISVDEGVLRAAGAAAKAGNPNGGF